MLDELETTAVELRVRNVTRFVGQVPHSSVPDWLNRLDIYVAPSRYESESFGVAVIEASACGIPVIVSDVGGLPEVVCDGETGFVVGRENVIELVKQLKILVLDEAKRREMGKKGRRWVLQKYEWSRCVDTMIDAYEKTLNPAMEKCHI
jgi:glycosyltransferase involved in cell wall biosynthesis